MEYISSDTNVWLDFATINRLEIPFKLPYTYIMNEDAITDELLSPKELRDNLVGLGLQAVELSEEEFYLAEAYTAKYTKPSLYDCVALAIAKVRGITLMTGDGPLRKAAEQEGVEEATTEPTISEQTEERVSENTAEDGTSTEFPTLGTDIATSNDATESETPSQTEEQNN